jgi:RNA polymerase sigma-70 factor (ECF subfamily)
MEEQLENLWHTGRAAWPDVSVSAEAFSEYLSRYADGGALPPAAGRHAAELYLACACAAGERTALAAFDAKYLSRVGVFLSRMRPQPVFVDEVRQTLREKLLVGPSPRIREYSGQGDLSGWLRVVTVRTALNMQRNLSERLDGGPDSRQGASRLVEPVSPELDYVKERYREGFRQALEHAFSGLTSEQRNLLRLHFIDGMTLHQLAVLSRVHRATVARWIAEARQQIMDDARTRLQQQLAVGSADIDSMIGLLKSRIDLSISRLLASRS